MKNLVNTFETKGKVNTHYYNGYGFTNKTNQVKKSLEAKGLINGIDFEIKNLMGVNTRTQIIKINTK